jgi:hypothetical protein
MFLSFLEKGTSEAPLDQLQGKLDKNPALIIIPAQRSASLKWTWSFHPT